MADANERLELPTEGPLLDRSCWKARPSQPAEFDPVLDRVKTLARGGLTSMIVLGDFLRRRIALLQQRSRMACMFTGVNDYSRIVRGAGSELSGAELEVLIRAMTGEAYAPESLALPRGVKALCEDQAMRTVVLEMLPTLNEGGLVVRQVGGNPNRGIRIPGTRPTASSAPTEAPADPSAEVRLPPGRRRCRSSATSTTCASSRPVRTMRCRRRPPQGGAGSTRRTTCAPSRSAKDEEVLEAATSRRSRDCEEDNVRSIPIRKDDEVPEAPTSRRSRDREEDRSRRLCRGDRSYMGEPASKSQKMAESGRGGRVAPGLRHRCRNAISRREGRRRRGGLRRSIDHRHHRHSSARHLHSSSRFCHRHHPNGNSRCHHHHHHRSSSRPRHRRLQCHRRGGPTSHLGHHPQEGGNPRSRRQDGGCGAPSAWLSPCHNLRTLRQIAGGEVRPPAGFFHHRWGAGSIVGSTTVAAHGRGGLSRSLGGRSRTQEGADPASRDGWRVSRGDRIGRHGGAPSAEPAVEEDAATAGAATAEVAEAPSSGP
jgi:hypothetical protein